MDIEQKIEALLFYKGEPMSAKQIADILYAPADSVEKAVENLKTNLENRGIKIVQAVDEISLRTAPECSDIIETLRKEELSKDIGKAGSETLSIILYKGKATRGEIDFIRGVNSTFILRNLLIRGLVDRKTNPKDQRSYLYTPTSELLSHMGIKSVGELPEYNKIKDELVSIERSMEEIDTESSTLEIEGSRAE